jgi:hypothetical protein
MEQVVGTGQAFKLELRRTSSFFRLKILGAKEGFLRNFLAVVVGSFCCHCGHSKN